MCNLHSGTRCGTQADKVRKYGVYYLTFNQVVGGANDVMVALQEGFGSASPTPASILSDGTLRVLSIGAALFSAPAGSMVVIEEVDNGLHPSRAKRLVEQFYSRDR